MSAVSEAGVLSRFDRYFDDAVELLARNGYKAEVKLELDDWVKELAEAPEIGVINPTFDPSQSRLSSADSFWIRVSQGGETAACIANRLFEADDCLSLIESWTLWYERRPEDAGHLRWLLPAGLPRIGGRLGHHGGLWVHPAHRKRGLSTLLPRMTRARSLSVFDVDWHFGMVIDTLARNGLPLKGYGYPNCVPCFEGYLPIMGRVTEMHLTFISRGDMQRQVERDSARLDALLAADADPARIFDLA